MSVLDGVLLLDKPVGITSARAVAVVKRRLCEPGTGPGSGRKAGPKVGHLGTLDPFASGLLPMCVGEGTKIAPYLNTSDKRYTGIVKLGVVTDTLDATGQVIEERSAPDPETLDLAALATAFTGPIEQIPPAFSAIKKGGVRMYELARRGEAPELEPRVVTIHSLSIVAAGPDTLSLDVQCSKGTYIRSLARDIGERIGCGALLAELRRTRFGVFSIDGAIALDALETDDGRERAVRAMLSPAKALAGLRELAADGPDAARLRSGQQAALAALPPPSAGDRRAKVVTSDGALAAIVCEQAGRWKLERVFLAEREGGRPSVAQHDPPC